MLQLLWPWVFLLLPLPWLVYRIFPAASDTNEAALRVPYLDDFRFNTETETQIARHRWPLYIYILLWLSLLLAAARPQWIGDNIELPVSGRDLLMAIDLSGSMKERDFLLQGRVISRLQATKAVASEFIDKRVGDRIGLVLFGERAYLQAPLTFDRSTVTTLLQESAIGLAGQSTAIGDAIGLAVKRLSANQDRTDNDRVLILLTDGTNTAGEIEPLKAAELAANYDLKIYTIGIGADRSMGRFGLQFLRGRSELDEATLKKVAQVTGGRYFRAHNTKELLEIYQLLDQLEPVERDTQSYRPTRSLFYWPLAIALLLATTLGITRLQVTA